MLELYSLKNKNVTLPYRAAGTRLFLNQPTGKNASGNILGSWVMDGGAIFLLVMQDLGDLSGILIL